MQFIDVPLFHSDFYNLLFRFFFNTLFAALIVIVSYTGKKRNQTFEVALLLVNMMVFFICFKLAKLEIGFGMAMGMFAIFSVISCRTDTIRMKEMAYLFVVIGLGAINALTDHNTSYAELLFANAAMFGTTFLLERLAREYKPATQSMQYDNLELLAQNRPEELHKDIRSRTGITPLKVRVDKFDLSKGCASITVFYSEGKPSVPSSP